MSRHRSVRSMNYNEEYDTYYDVYGQSLEEEGCISPTTAAEFMYNRDEKNHSMSAYLASDGNLPEEDESEDLNSSIEDRPRTDSISLLSRNLNQQDRAKLSACVEEMQNVVGDTIGENILAKFAIENNFNAENALTAALSTVSKGANVSMKEEPKPQRAKRERNRYQEFIGIKRNAQGKKFREQENNFSNSVQSVPSESKNSSFITKNTELRTKHNPFKLIAQNVFGQVNEPNLQSTKKKSDNSGLSIINNMELNEQLTKHATDQDAKNSKSKPANQRLDIDGLTTYNPEEKNVSILNGPASSISFSLMDLASSHLSVHDPFNLDNPVLSNLSISESSKLFNSIKANPKVSESEKFVIDALEDSCDMNAMKKNVSPLGVTDQHCSLNFDSPAVPLNFQLNRTCSSKNPVSLNFCFGDPALGFCNFSSISSPISNKKNNVEMSISSSTTPVTLLDLAQQHLADVNCNTTDSSLEDNFDLPHVLRGILPSTNVPGIIKLKEEKNSKESVPSVMPRYLPGLNTSHDLLETIEPTELYSGHLPKKHPSKCGFLLCMRLQVPSPPKLKIKSVFRVHNSIKPFDFNTPSPDDILKAKQNQAFKDSVKPSITEEPQITVVAAEEDCEKPDEFPANTQEVTIERTAEVPEQKNNNQYQLDTERVSRSKSRSPSPAKNFDTVDGVTSSRRAKPVHDPEELFSRERLSGKPLINLVVVGHVDAGKSTLMGHLLYRLGCVTKKVMHKNEQESKKLGKSSFMYAWVLDETLEERNRGITMDIAQSKFETPKKNVTLLDAPGHKDFIPNMITGASQADVAILVVDATRGEFETGFEAGGQTREHTLLIRSLGVSQLAIAVNKLDNVNWSEDRYKDIVSKLTAFLKQAGFKESDIFFVPCSGLTGDNLTETPSSTSLFSWYKGPCLVDVIDQFKPPERPVNKPFRMCIADIFKGMGAGFCISGRIESGILQNGERVLVLPAGEIATVKGVTIDESPQSQVFAGDHVSMGLSGVDINKVMCGDVICDPNKPVKVSTRFRARVVVFNIETPLTQGCPVVIHYQSMSEQAVIKKIINQLHKSTGEIIKKKPRFLLKNSSGLIELEVTRPICVELYKDNRDLGRFMLRAMGTTVAAGLVTQVM